MSVVAVEAVLVEESTGSRTRQAFRELRRNPTAILGFVLITLFVLVALFAPLLAPYDPTSGDLKNITLNSIPGPSADHWLGLDTQGRDELSRILYGARASLLVGVVSLSLGAITGMIIAMHVYELLRPATAPAVPRGVRLESRARSLSLPARARVRC